MAESHKDVMPPSTIIHVGITVGLTFGVASLWPLATMLGYRLWNTLYMFKIDPLWVWSVCGLSIIQPTATVTLSPAPTGLREQISGCGCILMTGSHCSRCWNTLYIYKEDLLWVWSVWGTSIKRTNRDPPPIPTTSTLRSQRADIRVWLHPYDR